MRASAFARDLRSTISAASEAGTDIPTHLLGLALLAEAGARLEAAVEALAADAGSGPARRIAKILDGEATP